MAEKSFTHASPRRVERPSDGPIDIPVAGHGGMMVAARSCCMADTRDTVIVSDATRVHWYVTASHQSIPGTSRRAVATRRPARYCHRWPVWYRTGRGRGPPFARTTRDALTRSGDASRVPVCPCAWPATRPGGQAVLSAPARCKAGPRALALRTAVARPMAHRATDLPASGASRQFQLTPRVSVRGRRVRGCISPQGASADLERGGHRAPLTSAASGIAPAAPPQVVETAPGVEP